jgi:hypothetical protein
MRSGLVRVALGGLATATLAGGFAVGLIADDGGHAEARRLGSGAAWFGSPRTGVVALIDGASSSRITRLPRAIANTETDVVQEQHGALLVDRAAGSVRRVDGATWDLSPPRPVSTRGDARLAVYAGGGAAWALTQGATVVQQLDPRSLSVIGTPQTLPGELTGTAVTSTGTLWVTNPTGDVRSYHDGEPVTESHVPDVAGATLVLAGDTPVVVDPGHRVAHALDPRRGEPTRRLCLDVPAGSRPLTAGATSRSSWLLTVVPTAGTLVVTDIADGRCRPFALGETSTAPRYGSPVEKEGLVFVPDTKTGQIIVVEPDAPTPDRKIRTRIDLRLPGAPLRLMVHDQRVWFDNPAGDQAGVIDDKLLPHLTNKSEGDGRALRPDGTPEVAESPRAPRNGSGNDRARDGEGRGPGDGRDGKGTGSGTGTPAGNPGPAAPDTPPAPTRPGDPTGAPPPPANPDVVIQSPPDDGMTPVNAAPPPVVDAGKPPEVVPGAGGGNGTTTTRNVTTTTRPTTTSRGTTTTSTTRPPAPTATIGRPPGPFFAGDTITLNALTSGIVTSTHWVLADGSPPQSNAAQVAVKFTTAGSKHITLTVTGPGGPATATADIDVATNSSSIANFRTTPATPGTAYFANDVASVQVGYDYRNASSRPAHVRVEPWTAGAGRPQQAVTSTPYAPASSGAGTVTFTIPWVDRPQTVDSLHVDLLDDAGNPLDTKVVPVNFLFTLPPPQIPMMDCLGYNPQALAVTQVDANTWTVSDGQSLPLTLHTQAHANLALTLARGANKNCFIGRSSGTPVFTTHFWPWEGAPPAPQPGEFCTDYDVRNLQITEQGTNEWNVYGDGVWRVFRSLADAKVMLGLMGRYTKLCSIGTQSFWSSNDDLWYLR